MRCDRCRERNERTMDGKKKPAAAGRSYGNRLMKKALALLLVMLLALAGYAAAGPWLAVRAIRHALQAQDAAALAAQVDFPALRGSLKAQMEDRLARATGPGWQDNLLGQAGLALAHGVLETAVDAMVTPGGLAAMMEGRAVWNRLQGGAGDPPPADAEPLHDARYRYESLSSFTATIRDAHGEPIVFVLHRDGLRWKLADIRLP